MAEKQESGLLQVTVSFEGSRTVLHLPKNMKIGMAIRKAAEQFKQDPRGLTFLYHGLEITDDMEVGVSFGVLVIIGANSCTLWVPDSLRCTLSPLCVPV